MEEWTEQEGLETCNEQDQEDSTPKQTSFTPQQAKRMGEHLIQRQKNEAMGYRLNEMGEYENAGAPDGAAPGETGTVAAVFVPTRKDETGGRSPTIR